MSRVLVPRFPLLERGTRLVLADAETNALRAFWHLSGDDLIPALAGFAHGGVKPVLVLRLRRLHAGGAMPVQEIPLYLRGPTDQGEQVFSVEAQPARYDAELGLSDTAGGWVMLARSNALDHAARVDVRLVPVENLGASDPTRRVPATPPEPAPLAPAPEGTPSPQPQEGTAPPPRSLAEQRSSASPSEPLRYGHLAPRGTELSIEAELRINGCAAPGSEIDLFGHPYRVGPGGRFQLVIRVDDRDLIKRAFELNPPNLPDRPADV